MMKRKSNFYKRTAGMVEAHVAGIPCLIRVDECIVVKGKSSADNPDDYYGYNEVSFTVFDRMGYEAKWLSKKLTKDEEELIIEKILEFCEE